MDVKWDNVMSLANAAFGRFSEVFAHVFIPVGRI